MTTTITAVNSDNVRHCILIDLEVSDTTTYYISNAYTSITFNGNTYTQLGYFLGMNEMQTDIKPTNNQISIALAGVPSGLVDDPGFLNLALNTNLKGSKIRVYRAFFDETMTLINAYLRFSGYVSNYALNETWDTEQRITSQTVNLQCSNVLAIIEKKYTGRRTNEKDFNIAPLYDTGMYRVKTIADSQFDFGKKA
jgi:hypothetical protein